jgi:hypothetical protein
MPGIWREHALFTKKAEYLQAATTIVVLEKSSGAYKKAAAA